MSENVVFEIEKHYRNVLIASEHVGLIYHNRNQWTFEPYDLTEFTAAELRAIANKLDELNQEQTDARAT